jgi:hypothetical protein
MPIAGWISFWDQICMFVPLLVMDDRKGVGYMWWKVLAVAAVVLVFVAVGALVYGARRWKSDVSDLRAGIDAARATDTNGAPVGVYDPRELDGLPEPIRRYYNTVLQEGQSMVAGARIEHTGTFNMGETDEQWKPFRSTQHVITQRPGFVWDARIVMAPGMTARVVDAYVAGRGILVAKLVGLLTVVDQQDTPEMAQGELMRFLAEGTWYPTALLPSQGVVWEALDDTHAAATLADGATTVRLEFEFDAQGLVRSVYSEGRYRDVDGVQVATPWRGRFWDYQRRDGMLIPIEGEVEWLLESGANPYWRGRIERIEYEFAQ